MTIIQKVTLASLKKNRRRTVVTILGTAVAVAMITALAVLAASFQDMLRRAVILDMGDWHIRYSDVDKTGLPTLEAYDNLGYMDLSFAEGTAQLPGREGFTRSSLSLLSYTESSYARLPISISTGRLPEKPGEIFLSKSFLEDGGFDWPLGQEMTLEFGYYWYEYEDEGETIRANIREARSADPIYQWEREGTRSFTVVGYGDIGRLEQGWQSSFTALSVFDPANTVAGQDLLTAYIGLAEVKDTVFDDGNRLARQLHEHYAQTNPGNTIFSNIYPSFNHELLGVSGVMASSVAYSSLLVFLLILLLIVVIGSVSLISNAFSISLAERVRALGMLAGVGATRRQKRSSVFFEAMVIGLFAIPAGILGGLAGIGITLYALGNVIGEYFYASVGLTMAVPLWVILFTVVFSLFILLLSAWLPARRASKVAPVDAMRAGGESGKIRKVRVSRITRRIFGFEAELGIKNSKRSRRRYLAILSSLIISVVLFLTVSAAMLFIRNSTTLVYGDELLHTVQFTIVTNRDDTHGLPNTDALAAELRALPHAGEMDGFLNLWGIAQLPPEHISPDGLEELTLDDNGFYHLSASIYALDDESFARYLQSAGLDASVMETEGLPAILLSPINTGTQANGWATMSSTAITPGYRLALPLDGWVDTESGEPTVMGLEIAAVSGVFPDIVNNRFSNARALPLVMRKADVEHFAAAQGDTLDMQYTHPMYLWAKSQDADKLYTEGEAFDPGDNFTVNVYNKEADAERDRMGMLVISVFTYGFIILITLVCAANIFNTISTGIALRTREFAMLRSVGLTPKGFNRMLDCETVFYGVKALLWGLPLSILLSWLLFTSMSSGFRFGFALPWESYIIAVVGVFLLVGLSMLYARSKLKNLNIAETLKNENW